MRKITLIISLLFFLGHLHAQEVQWAFRVIEYSSQKASKAFSAKQVLGKPNVLQGSGERPNAWQPKGKLKEEYIKVGFLTPIIPKQIVIAESFHPGYVSKVFVYDASGKEVELASFTPKATKEASRLLRVDASNVDFYVIQVKVVLTHVKGIPVAIDAIGMTQSDKPVELKISHNDMIKSNVVVTKLGKSVNSAYPEFGPLLSPDGKTLYLSRKYNPANIGGEKDLEDIWHSEWNEKTKKWGEAKNMGSPLNNKGPNFINSISPDGNTVLLGNSYNEDGTMYGGASLSYRNTWGWTFPKRLTIEDEENINEKTNFYLSNTQKVLLMSVETKKGNYGSRDLYVSFLKADSTWTKPLNLGSTVNTIGTEAAPFLAADERTLYFTSDGFAGYGGSDIYVTRRLDDTWTKWSEPENLGPIVNTSFDESFFTVSAFCDKVYYTSEGESAGDVDIYTLSLPEIIKPKQVMFVNGHVMDSKSNEPLPMVKILFENLETGEEVGVARSSPATGDFKIVLPMGNHYGYRAEKEGYVSVHDNIDLTGQAENSELKRDLYLTPIETETSIIIHNLFFDSGKHDLRKESYSELNRVAKLLIDNPNMKIEISGYSDNLGTHNDQISNDRAKSVAAYLLTKSGVEADRIVLKHYGEQKPIGNNSTAKGRQLNRRVEFKILSK